MLTIEERKKVHDWIEQQIAGEKIDKRFAPTQLAPRLLASFKYKKLQGILSDDQIAVLNQNSSSTRSRFPFGF